MEQLTQSLSLLHQSAARKKARRSTVSQELRQKPYYRKIITMKKQKVTFQMKGQDKIPEKTTKWSGGGQPSRKRIRNNDRDDDPGSWEKNGGKDQEDARNVYRRPRIN